MKCKKCLKWGIVQMYKPVMEIIKHLFCRIVANIVHGIKAPKGGGKKYSERILANHESELCEACLVGVCLYLKGKKR